MSANGQALLQLEGIHAFYGRIHVLRNVSLRVPERGIVALLGANGSGKSTMVNVISGFVVPAEGRVWFDGRQIQGLPPEKIVAVGITQVPQAKEMFPELSVKDNLELGAYLRKDKEGIREDLERVYAYFPVLRERRSALAGVLSGGQQQMVNIGRALMSRPRLFVLDEPSCRLAPIVVREIFEIIKKINESGVTVLLVEQNVRMAMAIAEYVYIIQNGAIVVADTKASLEQRDDVRRAYLGW